MSQMCQQCYRYLDREWFSRAQLQRYGAAARCMECTQGVRMLVCTACQQLLREDEFVDAATCRDCHENSAREVLKCGGCEQVLPKSWFDEQQWPFGWGQATCCNCLGDDGDDEEEEEPTRVCSMCHRELPDDGNHFTRTQIDRWGSQARCINCIAHTQHQESSSSSSEEEEMRRCSNCERNLPDDDRHFSNSQVQRWGDQARCIPCVAELSGASQQDGYVASCERCHTIARMDTMVVASFDSSLLMCQPCNHTYCWCAECRIVLRIQASVVISETRLCSGCAPAVRARTQLLQCSVCNMRLAAADFSSAETAQGSRRRCNTCVRPSSNQRAQSGDSLCIICAERERNVAYKSCWHLAACLQCAEKMSGCPVCRSKSTFVVLKLP